MICDLPLVFHGFLRWFHTDPRFRVDCRAPLAELTALEVWDKHQNCGRVDYTKYLSQEKEGADILTVVRAGSRNKAMHYFKLIKD